MRVRKPKEEDVVDITWGNFYLRGVCTKGGVVTARCENAIPYKDLVVTKNYGNVFGINLFKLPWDAYDWHLGLDSKNPKNKKREFRKSYAASRREERLDRKLLEEKGAPIQEGKTAIFPLHDKEK